MAAVLTFILINMLSTCMMDACSNLRLIINLGGGNKTEEGAISEGVFFLFFLIRRYLLNINGRSLQRQLL